jgi:hypothetical protein
MFKLFDFPNCSVLRFMFKGHLVKIEHTARIYIYIYIHCVCCVWEGGVGVWKSVCGIEC